jgi:HSP20 family protein
LFLSGAGSFQRTQWQPAADLYRTARGWIVKYELAGVRPTDVQLVISGHTIALHGLRRDVRIEETLQAYTMEISYNQFERTIELPDDLSQMTLTTDYRDGMLIVWLTSPEVR